MSLIILTTTVLSSACVFVICYCYSRNRIKKPEKILNIYSIPGRWYYVKYVTFLGILVFRYLLNELTKSIRYGGKVFSKNKLTPEEKLEKLQPLSNHENAFDAVFFQGVSQNGIYLCGGTERRHGGKINGLFYLVVPEYGLLLSEKLPDTVLNADPVSLHLMNSYSAEGISFSPILPMKKWKVVYQGKMRMQNNPEKQLEVKINANWSSDMLYFSYDKDMCYTTLAKAIAREKWDENLFKSLKEMVSYTFSIHTDTNEKPCIRRDRIKYMYSCCRAHQSHYEQMGYLQGTMTIEEKEYPLDLASFRDHSFGHKRDWSLMHRYIFHMLYLENGMKITLGVVSQPCTTSHLEMGYVVHPNKTVEAIDSCDLLLYQHGEKGNPPKSLNFCLTAGGITYEISVLVEYEAIHYVGNNIEARMVERFLKCTVNNLKGKGIAEWHYNNCKSQR